MDFIKEILESLVLEQSRIVENKFTITEYKESKWDKGKYFGKAKDKTGMTTINWSTKGHGVTYFGDKLEQNISVEIRKDGGTRIVFNGYCHSKEDFLKVLTLTW